MPCMLAPLDADPVDRKMFAGTHDPLTWMLHIAGVSRLIEQRGPASFTRPIDKSLLRHARPMIVSPPVPAVVFDCTYEYLQ